MRECDNLYFPHPLDIQVTVEPLGSQLEYNTRLSLFQQCLAALHSFVMKSRACAQPACPGVNNGSCPAPPSSEPSSESRGQSESSVGAVHSRWC